MASLYYSLWEGVVEQADCKISNHYLNDATTCPLARKLTFQVRCGQLNTGNARKKRRQALTDCCLLVCGKPDVAHHPLSGCEPMTGAYIVRHNTAWRILLKALKKQGRLGASVVITMWGIRYAELLADDAAATASPLAREDEQAEPPTPAARLATRTPEWVYTHPVGGHLRTQLHGSATAGKTSL